MAKATKKSPFKWDRKADYSFKAVEGKTVKANRIHDGEQKYLLTVSGERELFKKIESLRSKFKKLTGIQEFTSADIKLIRESGRKNTQATKRKAGQLSFLYAEASLYNQGLIGSIAKKFTGYGFEYEDLLSAGQAGLLKAIDTFDLKRGYRFSTFASWWIRQSIQTEMKESNGPIRVPGYILEARTKFFKAKQKLAVEGNFNPTVTEVAQTAQIAEDLAQVIFDLKLVNNLVEDYKQDDRGNNAPISKVIAEKNIDRGQDGLMLGEGIRMLNEVLNSLDDSTQFVLNHIYGLNGRTPKPMKEIAQLFNPEITKATVARIRDRAFEKMRKHPQIIALNEIDPDSLSQGLLALKRESEEDPENPETFVMYLMHRHNASAPEFTLAG